MENRNSVNNHSTSNNSSNNSKNNIFIGNYCIDKDDFYLESPRKDIILDNNSNIFYSQNVDKYKNQYTR